MNKGGIIFLTIFLIGFISATCNSTQIDINTASAEKLNEIIKVGPSTAKSIIANRTYNSLDDLARVKGIKTITLEKIKAEGLACVNKGETEEAIEETNEEEISEEEIELAPIYLNSNAVLSESKDIKTENNKEFLKRNLPIWGIIAFCIIFGAWFFIRRRKNKHGFE